MRDAAQCHALDDMRIDDGAAVVPDHVTADFWLADLGIEGHEHEMKLERMARIHLHAAVFREFVRGRHLQDMRGLEPRLHAFGQKMEVTMGDVDVFSPAQLPARSGIRCDTALIDDVVLRAAELMRRETNDLRLEFLRGMERRAAEHDGHAAADRAIARQTVQRIRPHHAN